MQCELFWGGAAALHWGVVIHALTPFCICLLVFLTVCLTTWCRARYQILIPLPSKCLSLSVADWMQQVELWGHCRVLGNRRDRTTAASQRVEFKCAALKSASSIPLRCFSFAGLCKHTANLWIPLFFCSSFFGLLLSSTAGVWLTHIQQKHSELHSLTLALVLTTRERRHHTVFKTD